MTHTCRTGQHDDHDVYAALCPCRTLLDLLANKWSALLIGLLEPGPLRFSGLRDQLPGISSKMLTRTLRRLEAASLITRTVYADVPPRVEYELTELGASAAVPLRLLRTWAEENLDHVAALNQDWAD
ncbi:cinnamoyl ester hydrolase [Mycobacterium kubicae]|uniref:Cinnamoyl ester hydrolase n=1 Tax=Mycobacterium kubicae TaxID=120959 RepID=A0AAX1J7C8_9MYCO|nr:helix-turn-helix domain-containing protein [Mycobacterium kubicae]MCV7093607.1 helix-turn-helix transcriptional regulator [Mycobacterium kubicae]OBF19819.1 cinnamoyl ester hydrolase [Mycobacterium kubicae]ORW02330.1 cinnamoyl ester hydrolase [Mycobacterium kubicae]QNI12843.1 helix-turn-helix transcriptional regulator [Mycobacterium kubicae]QPI36353.1 helix-turn-helix transcriptional regulator [Mycobacterium kubicae]